MGSIRVDILFFLLFSITFFCLSNAQCQLYLSSTSGDDVPNCGMESSPCRSLNKTIHSLNSLNSSCSVVNIFVYPGTYLGFLNRGVQFAFFGTRLTISPLPSSSDPVIFNGESQTFIMAIEIFNGSLLIQNIIFTEGNHANMHAGGLTITQTIRASYEIRNSQFISCNGFDAGGLYASVDLSSFVENCSFVGCHGNNGGGASLLGGVISILSTSFTGNTAIQFGGGLNSDADFLTIQKCSFQNNTSSRGGGCSITSSVKIESTQFLYNIASDDGGGGIHLSQAENSTLSDVEIGGNKGYTGGGLYFETMPTVSQLVLSSVFIHDNVADSLGGGAFIGEALNVALNAMLCSENRAVIGGCLYIKSIYSIKFSQAMIRRNRADNGGGLACDSTIMVSLDQSTFFENMALDCAYSDHTVSTGPGACPGIFSLCAQKQPVETCSLCPGSVCKVVNSTYHCFSNNTQNCLCPINPTPIPAPSSVPAPSSFPTPTSPRGPPVTPASTIAGVVIGIMVGLVVVIGIGYYCRLKMANKTIDYIPVK